MKTLVLALLIPAALCAACSQTEQSSDMTASAPDAAPTPAVSDATAPGGALAAADAPSTTSLVADQVGPPTAQVSFVSADGHLVRGDLMVTNQGGAVAIRGILTGLEPGSEHGFHVHQVGECSLPDFASAGGHFNPTEAPHGEHLGDLPNIKADKDGHATVDALVKGPNLIDQEGAPTQIIGRSLVVHAKPDDHNTQPSGDSGDRIACGVIRIEHL
jgi:Cu-Zn family superoxide dismutase